jgi:hypothetical protein
MFNLLTFYNIKSDIIYCRDCYIKIPENIYSDIKYLFD